MGQTNVFEQVIKLIPRTHFSTLVERHKGDRSIRTLDSWTWFGALLFGQLSGHDSIRAIERVFCHSNSRMKRFGFTTVCRSTLSDANKNRPVEILEDLFQELIVKAKSVIPGKKFFGIEGKDIFLLDSTTIHLCLSLCPWAKHKTEVAGVKLHTAVDLSGEIPQFAVIAPANIQDITIAKNKLKFSPGTTAVFDRGYFDQKWFGDLSDQGVFFVTRARKNNKFKLIESREVNRTLGFKCDQTVYCKDRSSRRAKGKVRRIHYVEPDTGKEFVFITNRFDLSVEVIAQLYKARWTVELFFKALKQNLRVRKFLGTSANAVKAQILVALISYILVMMIRAIHNGKISIPDAMAVVGTLLLVKEPLSKLLGCLPRVTRHPPDPQLWLPI